MSRSILFVLLLVTGLLGVWGFGAWAQVIDADACERACYEQKSACITSCGEDNDPVECEGRCEDEAEDCLAECR
jgi:hypothetical protein